MIDFQEKDRQAIENMWRRKLINKKQVLTYADFVDAKEADVEDMLGEVFYLQLLNAEYAAVLGKPITAKDLKSKHPRITVRMEQYFNDNSLGGEGVFNHYRPARYLAENVGELNVPLAVLDRFERIFSAVNKQMVRARS